jgi:hypothetical protein
VYVQSRPSVILHWLHALSTHESQLDGGAKGGAATTYSDGMATINQKATVLVQDSCGRSSRMTEVVAVLLARQAGTAALAHNASAAQAAARTNLGLIGWDDTPVVTPIGVVRLRSLLT